MVSVFSPLVLGFSDLHQQVTERDGQLHRVQTHLEIVIPLLKAGRHISYFVCAKATANNNCSHQLRLNKGATHMAQTKLIPSCAKHCSNFESEIRMAHKLNRNALERNSPKHKVSLSEHANISNMVRIPCHMRSGAAQQNGKHASTSCVLRLYVYCSNCSFACIN